LKKKLKKISNQDTGNNLNSMFAFLKKPYPYLFTLKRNLLIAGGVGILSMFLNYSRLFHSLFYHNTIIPSIYVAILSGLIIGSSLFLVIHIIPHFFVSNHRKDNWSIGNELIVLLGVLITISVFNYLFFLFISKDNTQLHSIAFFLKLVGYVISTGTVFFSTVLWINYTVILKRNLRQVTINNELLEEKLAINETQNETKENIIELNSTLKNEVIRFDINKLQFIKSDGNYIEIYIKNQDKTEVKLFRAPLQLIEEKLQDIPGIIRTHRSYLVNIPSISKTEGNARNYQLHFDGIENSVPVSRSRFSVFNEAVHSLGLTFKG